MGSKRTAADADANAATTAQPLAAELAPDRAGSPEAGHHISTDRTRARAPTAAGPETQRAMTGVESAEDLEFYFAAEIIYHQARADFLTSTHRVSVFLSVAAGTAVVTESMPSWMNRSAGVLVALLGIADVIFDPVGRAGEHRALANDYLDLAAELKRAPDSAEVRSKLTDAWMALSRREPPLFRVAKKIAHNKAIASLGRDPGARLQIPWYKSWLAQVCRFNGE